MNLTKDQERLLAKIDIKDTGCWDYTQYRTAIGYGQFWLSGKPERAHRAAYSLFKGHIPAGLFVCHTCDNPSCINPDHLFLGTHQDNMDDRTRKGRSAVGLKHGKRRFSDEEELLIAKSVGKQRDIAKLYKTTQSQVWRIKQKYASLGVKVMEFT